MLAMAQGFLQLKQIPRARNFLKRLTRMEWNDANADYLENACLLLADMYINMGKYAQVDKLLDSCIRHNEVFTLAEISNKQYTFFVQILKMHKKCECES